jgi:hypothetical protein
VRLVLAAAALVSLLSAGCVSQAPGRLNVLDARTSPQRPATHLGLPLRTGQLLLTEAPGAYSFVFVLIPAKFYNFTHAAIVSIEDGQPWVYDISGEYQLGFNERPMDNVDGGMRRTPFVEYAAGNLYGEVFDPPEGVDGNLVAAFARQQYDAGVKFDAYFRFDEHQKLFCTELVELAMRAGGSKPNPLEPVRNNPSLKTGMQWLGVPLDTALPAGIYQNDSKYMGALGLMISRSRAYTYFAAKRELHRRFRPDQRLGYLFNLKQSGDIELRPEISAYVLRATKAFEDAASPPPPGDPRHDAVVRRIADEMFGPISDG